jgi:threonine dehydrogenase-like Zn-dependent dehydrogenase
MRSQINSRNLNHVFPFPRYTANENDAFEAWSAMLDGLPDTPPPEELESHQLRTEAFNNELLDRVTESEESVVAVIGVGYVGLHLVTAFAPHYKLIAFDVSKKRLKAVASELSQYSGSITWTTDATKIAHATHFLIAVPTSLLPDSHIDTSYLREAISNIALYARPGATVVVESSVAVGMTRQLLAPLMRSRGLMAGMSPEVK